MGGASARARARGFGGGAYQGFPISRPSPRAYRPEPSRTPRPDHCWLPPPRRRQPRRRPRRERARLRDRGQRLRWQRRREQPLPSFCVS